MRFTTAPDGATVLFVLGTAAMILALCMSAEAAEPPSRFARHSAACLGAPGVVPGATCRF